MIDVFVRVPPFYKCEIRRGMWVAVNGRWRKELDVRVRVLPSDRDVRGLRELAEHEAKSDPYIFTDDDVLIVGKDWVKRGVEALLAHPEYAIVSSLSLVEGENLAKGTGTIYEMHAVGAPSFIRKGFCKDLPPMDINSECGVLHKHVLDQGKKMGLVNGLRHNHLGHGFSGNPALHWGF